MKRLQTTQRLSQPRRMYFRFHAHSREQKQRLLKKASFASSSRRPSSRDSSARRSIVQWYSHKLETHPLLTKGLTSGIISGSADLLCQAITRAFKDGQDGVVDDRNSQSRWDWYRTGRFVFLGAVWVAPATHFWYGALSTRIVPGNGTAWTTLFKRVAIDQFGFAPIFLTSFLSALWTLEGDAANRLPAKLKDNVPEMVVANWSLWIPAMSINFSLVPLKYQVLFSNVVALAWNVYVSYKSASLRGWSEDVDAHVEAVPSALGDTEL